MEMKRSLKRHCFTRSCQMELVERVCLKLGQVSTGST